MKKYLFLKEHRYLYVVLSITVSGIVNARWVAFKNATGSSITVKWNNARTDATSTIQPEAIELMEIKPNTWAGSNYAYSILPSMTSENGRYGGGTRNVAIYVSVNGMPLSVSDAEELNTYITNNLGDYSAKSDPKKYAVVLYQEVSPETDETELVIAVPRVDDPGYLGKLQEWLESI